MEKLKSTAVYIDGCHNNPVQHNQLVIFVSKVNIKRGLGETCNK